MLTLSVKSDVRALSKKLDALARKQLPFATAQALNGTAEQVRDAQRENMRKVLDKPTPFTLNSVAIKRASKSNPVALVYVKPIAVSYLLPYEIGGKNKLNSLALLKPVAQKVNQYGNLPRNAIKRLLANPNVFAGAVTFKKSGQTINGIWMRPKVGQRTWVRGRDKRAYGSLGNTQFRVGGVRTGLQLLVKFEDAHEVRQNLDYRGVGKRVVAVAFRRELDAAMAKALASAR
ncbi:hypothetical protein [Burkholderia gladioli]|uniref:hypothetical protein n=1 Tax=Burkholderia gladioli TaxID=28095 RepID=UPI0016417F97|nr:hypothetical protein [Burkholderia gladioli]